MLNKLPVIPDGGVEVEFLAGTYPLTTATACGTVGLRGTATSPVVFRGAGAHGSAEDATIFDATSLLDASGLRPVSNATVLALINPAAKGKLLELSIPAAMGYTGGLLEWNRVPLTPSVWPDKGLGYVRRVFDEGAVWAAGRTKGPPPHCQVCYGSNTSTPSAPCGGNISLAQQPTGDWEAELAAGPGFGQVELTGYFNNDWYKESHHVARVVRTAANTSLQFASYSRYGLCEALEKGAGGCNGAAPGRFTVSGLLSEVDNPGEYFYNKATRMLFVYPLPSGSAPADSNAVHIGFPSGPGLITLENASWVTVRDLSVSGSTGTAISIIGGQRNTVGGCVISNAAKGITLTGGYRNGILGNDIYDTGTHLYTTGNSNDGLANLVPTNNLIQNNHLTQVHQRGPWSLHLTGMGDRFSHNLLHDSAGQLLLPGGPLTMLDHNEIFNTGYQEGDGGVVYSGASLTAGYGKQYRENFVHHSLEVPGLHGRGGIYFDDHEGSVTNCSGNVMYKAAGRSFLVNGGAANNITRNLIVNGGVGIYNQHADDVTKALPLYDNGTLKRGDKGDYIWKTEQALGVPDFASLLSTPLAQRFPTFARLLAVNSSTAGWASAVDSNFRGNVFLNNTGGNVCLLTSYHPPNNEKCDGDLDDEFIDQAGSVEASWEWFPAAATALEFVNASLGFDTRAMGLRCDGWRKSMPVGYRPWVKAAFDGVPSAAVGSYTPEAAAIRAGLESGRALVLNFTQPCPPTVKSDCRAIWVAWGECEADGQQVMRYTVEVDAEAGGAPCQHEDGFAQRQAC
jgi:hypothetical protein